MRVLMVLPQLDGGGIESVMYNYALSLLPETKIDFLVFSETQGLLESPLLEKGLRVFHSPSLHKSAFQSIRFQTRIMRDGEYDIVHVNSYTGIISLACAKVAGVRTRICHAHTIAPISGLLAKIQSHLIKLLDSYLANGLFACSKDVYKWTWGKMWFRKRRMVVIPNAIDVGRFSFSPEARVSIRRSMDINENCLVLGNVARFSPEKNHRFLLHVLAEVRESIPNSKLVLVGRGETEESVKVLSRELGVQDHVVFTGIRSNISQFLSAFDVFLLPSHFEGLPVTLIEAQANGLPSICSDKVSSEVSVTDLIRFLPIDQGPSCWARILASGELRRQKPADSSMLVRDAGYDVESASKTLVNNWRKLVEMRGAQS